MIDLKKQWLRNELLHATELAAVNKVLSAALDSVDPYQAVCNLVSYENSELRIGYHELNIDVFHNIYLLAFGKASIAMALAILDCFGKRIDEGWIITKDDHFGEYSSRIKEFPQIQVFEASHPIPDERGLRATQYIISETSKINESDLVIVLISGGGSALFTLPYEGIILQDIQEITQLLLNYGASIDELNVVRKHLDQVKGGGLAQKLYPAKAVTLILSDVIGDPLDKIASGPMVADPSTFKDAVSIIEKYSLWATIPETIRDFFSLGVMNQIPDTPKQDNYVFKMVECTLAGNNSIAGRAGLQTASKLGFNTLFLGSYFQGEAKDFGGFLAAIARQIDLTGEPIARPACIAAGGETTVQIKGTGVGGRNQEAALGSVKDVAGIPDLALVFMATDGGDGSSPAAGAIVTGTTYERAMNLSLSVNDYLKNNDSFNFFKQLGDNLITGPTLTNVNDLAFVFLF
jgi:hydroxypyruvate reductase